MSNLSEVESSQDSKPAIELRLHAASVTNQSALGELALLRQDLRVLQTSIETAIKQNNIAVISFLKEQADEKYSRLYAVFERLISKCEDDEIKINLERERSSLRTDQGEFEARLMQMPSVLTSRQERCSTLGDLSKQSFLDFEMIKTGSAEGHDVERAPFNVNSKASTSSKVSPSHHSSLSSRASSKFRKLESIAKREKARLRLSTVDTEIALKARQLELENQFERFQAKRNFDEAVIEAKVLNSDCDNDDHNNKNDAPLAATFNLNSNLEQLQIQPANHNPVNKCQRVFPHEIVERETSKQSSDNSADVLEESKVVQSSSSAVSLQNDQRILASIATAVSETMSAPKLECLKFDGNPLDYTAFIQCFTENIGRRNLSPMQKLMYLMQVTEGKARRSIEHCSNMSSYEEGYELALNTLADRFGRPTIIGSAFKQKLFNHSIVKNNDKEAISEYALILRKCFETLNSIGNVAELNNSLVILAEKLPNKLNDTWRRRYAKIMCKESRTPHFFDFVKFVENEANLLNAYPEQSSTVRRGDDRYQSSKINTRKATCANASTSSQTKSHIYTKHASQSTGLRCYYCLAPHVIANCQSFAKITLKERKDFLIKQGRCFNCFFKHHTRECRKPHSCTVNNCEGRHNVIMHNYSFKSSNQSAAEKSPETSQSVKNQVETNEVPVSCNSTSHFSRGYFNVVPVVVQGNGKSISVYAFLDPGSDTTFCKKNVMQSLGLSGSPKRIALSTLGKRPEVYDGETVSFTVSSLDGNEKIFVDQALSIDELPVHPNAALTDKQLEMLPHLKGIDFHVLKDAEVGLLIGNDLMKAHKVLEEREGNGKQPHAIRSLLGWSLIGPSIETLPSSRACVNFALVENELDREIKRSWFEDFQPNHLSYPTSVEDREVLHCLKKNVVETEGHFHAPLPWRHNVALPTDSFKMAEKRLTSTKRRLQKDKVLHEKYIAQMNEYIKRGYAEEIPLSEKRPEGVVWYLPHHPVYNPRKPDKVRIVFDCSAKHRGVCLNDALMQGPDLVNKLVSVLTRFRQKRIALTADVESMFHQVRVRKEDCDALRFLWWPQGDLSKTATNHRMLVHVFGATSSPCCATFCLRQSAVLHGANFDPEVTKIINRDFYVDDCLTSASSAKKATNIVEGLRKLLALSGFRLTKWISTSTEVLDSIPVDERAKSVKNVTLDGAVKERVLGVRWNVSSDKFGFDIDINLNEQIFTRRKILATVNSMYDPLGFVAPVTLNAKIMQQKIIQQQLDWDEELQDSEIREWQRWFSELGELRNLTLPRCFVPPDLGEIIDYQIHHFCDASVHGYGFVSYLRLIDKHGVVHCSFLCGKSKVTPPQSESIPRLELVAAVLAVKADHWLKDQLEFPFSSSVFWTDSSCVRHSIYNKTKRFRTFVANRLAKIHRQTEPSQWRHVRSCDNPADHASRGLSVEKLLKSNWLKGPKFLWKNEDLWPISPEASAGPDNLPTDFQPIPQIQAAAVSQIETCTTLNDFIEHYSSLTRLKIGAAWLVRFILFLKDKSNVCSGKVTVDEMQSAEAKLVAYVQRKKFAAAFNLPNNQKLIKGSSDLRALLKVDPQLEGGVLRVGGRLENAPILFESKHPAILPSNHFFTSLVIRHYHQEVGHSGLAHTWTAIRQKYWILKGGASVRKELKKCVLCRKRNAPRIQQLMSVLPPSRLKPDEPPFSYVGVDYFGPFYTKRARSLEKRYGCIFSCLSSRAVHIEMAHSLTTDSFINVFRRFIGRRGKPKEVFSDNGTNFKGAERVLRESLQEFNQLHLDSHFRQNEIVWNFNPPFSSHMGGSWERMIRSIRKILNALLGKQLIISDDTLHTLFVEVEKILNSRPLTPIVIDPQANEVLTPNHLLLIRQEENLPPGIFQNNDLYATRRWKQAQHLTNVFWQRWQREYLPTIALRQKWRDTKRNLQPGDIVLVVDDNMPRGQWRMGRVTATFPDRHGFVRIAEVKTQNGLIRRPITKLCLISESSQTQQPLRSTSSLRNRTSTPSGEIDGATQCT